MFIFRDTHFFPPFFTGAIYFGDWHPNNATAKVHGEGAHTSTHTGCFVSFWCFWSLLEQFEKTHRCSYLSSKCASACCVTVLCFSSGIRGSWLVANDYSHAIYVLPFTGWTEYEVVINAQPRYPGHIQPNIPLWLNKSAENTPEGAAMRIEAATDAGEDIPRSI